MSSECYLLAACSMASFLSTLEAFSFIKYQQSFFDSTITPLFWIVTFLKNRIHQGIIYTWTEKKSSILNILGLKNDFENFHLPCNDADCTLVRCSKPDYSGLA